MRTPLRLAVIVLALLSPVTSRAADGVIEINQARALTGGVTPGDAAGFPVLITSSGSYRLTSNLDVRGLAPNDVIRIDAPDVTLDLGGFTILGDTACSGSPPTCMPTVGPFGVRATAVGVVVRNGTVSGMAREGVILSAQDGRVEEVVATSNGSSGIIVQSNSVVRDCVASNNGNNGIQAATGSLVYGVVTRGNAGSGVNAALGSLVLESNSRDNNLGILGGAYGHSAAVGNTLTPQFQGGAEVACNLSGAAVSCP